MLMTKERLPAIRTLRGWAISVLDIARRDPPPGFSPEAAAAEIREVLDSIGDTCPECPPED
jgi:hypothetical protein